MDFKGLYGKAKSGFKNLGDGDKDLLESIESDNNLGAVEQRDAGPDSGEEYVRGEDMVADLERDMEISRQNRKRMAEGSDDDSLGVDLSDLD